MKLWQEEGLQAFTNSDRSDKGRPRIAEDLQNFILGFYALSSHVVALVLRHAILPKTSDREYNLPSQCAGLVF
jgi:hypothetical protein